MNSLKRNITYLLFIFMALTFTLIAQEDAQKYTPPPDTDSIDSWLGGVYGNYPILDREDFRESKIRLSQISGETDSLKVIKDSLQNELESLRKADTIKLKDHVTFFGGLFTIPSLNEDEQKIKDLHEKISEHRIAIRDLDEELKELELEENEIMKLIEKNKKYRMVKLFWGFANWEVEKE